MTRFWWHVLYVSNSRQLINLSKNSPSWLSYDHLGAMFMKFSPQLFMLQSHFRIILNIVILWRRGSKPGSKRKSGQSWEKSWIARRGTKTVCWTKGRKVSWKSSWMRKMWKTTKVWSWKEGRRISHGITSWWHSLQHWRETLMFTVSEMSSLFTKSLFVHFICLRSDGAVILIDIIALDRVSYTRVEEKLVLSQFCWSILV